MQFPRRFIAFVPVALLLLLLLRLSREAPRVDGTGKPPLGERSIQRELPPAPPVELRTRAVDRLKAEVPGLRVDFDPELGTPHFIVSTESFLTGPGGRGLAMPDDAPGGDAPEIVRSFLRRHEAVFGHGSEVLETARAVRDYVTAHSQMRTLVWQQQHAGIRVFEATMQAHLTAKGELVNIASRMLPEPGKAAAGQPQRVGATAAVRAAAQSLGDPLDEGSIQAKTAAQGEEQQQEFDARPLLNEASAQLVWLPQNAEHMRLCWEVISVSRRTGWMHRTLVDAESGVVARQVSLTEAISPASYRVFTGDSPTPLSPGHPTPLGTQPPEVSRELVTLPALNTTASPNGWINDGGNETLGNNVDAHLDLNGDNLADIPRPQGSPARVFDTPLNLTLFPSSYRSASVVNLFYWTNVMHDRLYELGFTEAAGNFQTANFGRGGLGNDAVRADAQDGLDLNNAIFSTPPDGSPPRMQMFLYDGPSSMRDSCFDAEVILHEYAHGLSNRLVGGGVGISALQSRGMGEGWSDFYALSILSEPEDSVSGNYASGGYIAWLLEPAFHANYYYGVRRYPYCTDMQRNPLTFRDIDPGQADSHPGIPRSPVPSSSATSVHNIGEVWCLMLWEARAAMIAKHGPAAGNTMMLRLTTDGMKLAPPNPNFIHARDAILQADQVLNSGGNRAQLLTAFAKRGLGSGAFAPPSSTTSGVAESLIVPDPLTVSPGGEWTPVVVAGSSAAPPKTWTVTNAGNAPMTWNVSTMGAAWLSATPAGGTLAAGASAPVSVSLTPNAALLAAGTHSASLRFSNTGSGVALARPVSLTVEPLTNPVFEETWESGAVGSVWSISGTGPHQTTVSSQNGPRAGGYHLTMDSSGGPARNEATLMLNLTGRRDLQLSFWLKSYSDEPHGPPNAPFTSGADFDGVAISANGNTWYEVLPLRTAAPDWTKYTINLDAELAARGLAYGPGFRIRFNHYDDYAIATDGFAFDDIRLVEVVQRQLRLRLPDRVREGEAPVTATLEIAPAPVTAQTVPLSTNFPGEISIPASLSVPAGTASVTFSISIADDAGLDGTQTALISATLPTYRAAEAALPVEDNETAVLTLSLPGMAAEGGGGINGLVQLDAPVAKDTPVTLTSSNPAKLAAPAQVIIPAGEFAASVSCEVLEDALIDGTQTVTVTASVAHWTPGAAAVEISDNESSTLTLTLPPAVTEGLPPLEGRVEASGRLSAPLTVTLTADDRLQLEVPASVTIPAGQSGVSFPVAAVDDGEADGAWLFGILATAPGFGDATAPIQVNDDDAVRFTLSPIGAVQTPGRTFALTITALDVNGAVVPAFHSPLQLRASDSAGNIIPVTPDAATGWNDGEWTGQVKVGAPGTGIVITADDGAGHTGSSNPFDAAIGPLHHFGFSAVTMPQYHDAPIALTIRAEDDAGNVVPDFSGTATLSAITSSGTAMVLPFSPQGLISFTAGAWSGSVVIPFTHTGMRLRAAGGAFSGQSEVFAVETPPALTGSVVLRDGFDSATPRNWWNFSGTGTWRTEITAAHGPSSAPYHMVLDSSQADSFARNEATLTVDLAGRTGVVLNYKIKSLGDEIHYAPTSTTTGGNFDAVLISRDGVNWWTVAQPGWFPSPWNNHTLPLDEIMAQRGWSYNSTFKIRFNQYDDRPAPDDGLAFDDIFITADPRPALSLQLPSSAVEGGPALTGTVTLPAAAPEDTVIVLSSSASAKLSVSASVIVPAGQTSAAFTLTPGNDSYVDGDKTAYISATPPTGDPARAPVLVTDDEIRSFALSVSGVAREGSGSVNVQIELPEPAFAPVTIKLTSSDAAQFTVPPVITIMANERYGTAFQCIAVDDNWVEGPHSVTLTASREGVPGATATVTVNIGDNDASDLNVTSGANTIDEGQSVAITLSLRGPARHPVPVTITNYPALHQLSGPAEVIIPEGASSATFTLTAPQNSVSEGNRNYQLNARSPWSNTQFIYVSVREDDPAEFRLNTVPPQPFGGIPQQTAGIPFELKIEAITGWSSSPATGFQGHVNLSATGSAGPLTVVPAVAGPFINGVWTGMVMLTPSSPGVTLVARAGGVSGASGVFDVFSAALHHFEISPITSPRLPWEPFSVTITAMDALNNVLPGYTDPVQLSFAGSFSTTPFQSIPPGTNPVLPAAAKCRLQVLYFRSDLGGIRKLKAMRCSGSLPSALTQWTVRVRSVSLISLPASWDSGPWTTVFTGLPTRGALGTLQMPFSRSFDLDATSDLLVDISYELPTPGTAGVLAGTNTWLDRMLGASTSSTTALPPAEWTGSGGANVPTPLHSQIIPRMDFFADHPPLAVSSTGSFTAGRWTGPIAVNGSGHGLSLTASTGYISSTGPSFDVVSAVPADADGDRLPDSWEIANALDPGSSSLGNGSYGDPDGDGLVNFIEFALSLPPHTPNPDAAPRAAVEINPADGLAYLTVTWLRPASSAYTFALECSADGRAWSAAPAGFQTISVTPAAGGVTETVVSRVVPPANSANPHRFVRLRVSAP